MNELVTKVRTKASTLATKAKVGATVAMMSAVCAVPAWASEVDSGSAASGIAINFDIKQMFQFANIIIEALMPVVYITAGLGIGFLIINSLKNAFK